MVLDEIKPLHDYLGLRESAKHYLLLGYARMRRAAGRAGPAASSRRRRLSLTPEELPQR
ncbi:MAG: hypothetical protein U0736_04055 [Gemmataceae bacterium]